MFYSQFVLSKKGPLAKIWLAAHWEKKLSKAQIYETNVQDAVEEIMQPKVKLSLRTTGHLLLGLSRIYARQVKYVLADCNEALIQIKMDFKPGSKLDKELRNRDENSAITPNMEIPEVISDFYDNIPEITDLDMGSSTISDAPVSQSRIDEITLRDDFNCFDTASNRNLAFDANEGGLDDFGEREQFDFIEGSGRGNSSRASSLLLDEFDWCGSEPNRGASDLLDSVASSTTDDEQRDHRSASLVTLFDDAPSVTSGGDKDMMANTDVDMMLLPADGFGMAEELDMVASARDISDGVAATTPQSQTPSPTKAKTRPNAPSYFEEEEDEDEDEEENEGEGVGAGAEAMDVDITDGELQQQMSTTLPVVYDEIEDMQFQLEQSPDHPEKRRGRPPKKQHGQLLIDEQKQLTGAQMKSNMEDYSDIIAEIDLAPPTEELMYIYEYNQLEKMMSLPACHKWILDQSIIDIYQGNLIPRTYENETGDALLLKVRKELDMTDNISVNAECDDLYEGTVNSSEDGSASMLFNGHSDGMEMPDENLEPSPFPDGTEATSSSSDDSSSTTSSSDNDDEDGSPPAEKKRRSRNDGDDDEDAPEEEEVLNRRTKHTLNSIANKLRHSGGEKIPFDAIITKGSTRRTAAQKFYALLELKKWSAIELGQESVSAKKDDEMEAENREAIDESEEAPYGTIWIAEGPKLHECLDTPQQQQQQQ